MSEELTIGFLPLVDACLPILVREHGFAEEEGVSLRFLRDVSWATVLDRLLYGHSDAAHLLAPLAIATTLGRGRPAQPLAAPFVLGLNGNAITVRNDLAAKIAPTGGLGDPKLVGARLAEEARALSAQGKKLRFGVIHLYSSHSYMLRYWLAGCGVDGRRSGYCSHTSIASSDSIALICGVSMAPVAAKSARQTASWILRSHHNGSVKATGGWGRARVICTDD